LIFDFCFLISAAFAPALAADRTILILQFPPDFKVALNLFRTGAVEKIDGSAEVKRSKDNKQPTRVEVSIKDAPAPSSVKPEYQAYVVWVIDAKANFSNLGTISKSLKADTALKSFGILVSLEADPKAKTPKGLFVLESQFPEKKNSFFGMTKVVYSESQ
jgi:hypothetical protein